jgi:hypothetical protein
MDMFVEFLTSDKFKFAFPNGGENYLAHFCF